MGKPIVIGYDGSAGAEFAGEYLAGRHAIVVTASEAPAPAADADATAAEAASVAWAAGIEATARTVDGDGTVPTPEAIAARREQKQHTNAEPENAHH